MAALVTCHKCKKYVSAKSVILCSECNNTFEFECGGLPEKVYRLMEPESKRKWKCKFCRQKPKVVISSGDATNITLRKKLTSQNLNESTESVRFSTPVSETQMDDSHILTELNTTCDSPIALSRSVDNTLSGSAYSVQEMKETISMLTSQLASTQVELENTILENNDLHRNINKLTKENELLKTLCQKPLPEIKIDSTTMKKNRRYSAQFPDIRRSLFASPRPQSLTKTDPKPDEHIMFQSLQLRIKELSQKLQQAEKEISFLTNKISAPQADPFKLGASRQASKQETNQKQQENASMEFQPCTANKKPRLPILRKTSMEKRKVFIVGDEQVRNVREILQKLLGDGFIVRCVVKSGAQLNHILDFTKQAVSGFTRDDFIVLAGGCNDTNPYNFHQSLNLWLSSMNHTNVIISEIPYNMWLNEEKLNYELKFICSKYCNVTFLDMNYSTTRPHKKYLAINLSRSVLREILQINYKNEMSLYNREYLRQIMNIPTEPKSTIDNQTQTDDSFTAYCNEVTNDQPQSNECNVSDNYNSIFTNGDNSLFRV